MNRNENLSLDEFATAPRKRAMRSTPEIEGADAATDDAVNRPDQQSAGMIEPATYEKIGDASPRLDAKKALRQVKRVRMKGSNHFVNVNLDRETKRRLKLASFNSDTSMQAIMEKAIRKFLDENGF